MSYVHALDYSLGTDYFFAFKKDRVFLDSYYSTNSSASFHDIGIQNASLLYSEGAGAMFVNAFPTDNNTISFQFGYGYMDLNFRQNPSFNQKAFNDAVFSVGYITTSVEDWRIVFNMGIHSNVDHFSFSNNSFYTGMIWGRLTYSTPVGVHIGFLGQSGLKSTYLFPILGVDFYLSRQWKINAVFPLDFSVQYYINENWSSGLNYRSFGGWYRSFHRVGSGEPNPYSMFSLNANGADLSLAFQKKMVSLEVFAGANFGGWIEIRDKNGDNSEYYPFNYSGFVGGKASLDF